MVDTPEPAVETPAAPVHVKKKRRKLLLIPLVLLVIPAIIFALWTWIALGWAYSTGERAGYIQKISKKGWLCKTWEGEIAMIPPPGTVTPQLFDFTVRNDSLANILERDLGKRVSLTYEQHRGIPTSCFGETEYFITNVRILEP